MAGPVWQGREFSTRPHRFPDAEEATILPFCVFTATSRTLFFFYDPHRRTRRLLRHGTTLLVSGREPRRRRQRRLPSETVSRFNFLSFGHDVPAARQGPVATCPKRHSVEFSWRYKQVQVPAIPWLRGFSLPTIPWRCRTFIGPLDRRDPNTPQGTGGQSGWIATTRVNRRRIYPRAKTRS